MLDYADHIQKKLTGEKKVFILKGFPELTLESLNCRSLVQLDFKTAFENNTDLTSFKQQFIPKLIALLGTGENYILLYEQYICLAPEISDLFSVYGYQSIILRNNLFHLYYPAGNALTDLMKQQIDLETSEVRLVQRCYSDYKMIDDTAFVQYADIDSRSSIVTIDIFDKDPAFQLVPQSTKPKFQPMDADYYIDDNEDNFTFTIYQLISRDEKDIVLEAGKSLADDALSILNCLHLIGFRFTLYRRETIVQKSIDYTPYLKILHRRNPSWNFKEFQVYKNPGYSLETQPVSQADIIHTIVNNAIAANDNRDFYDVFVTAPTGAGKSLLFQIPAIYLAEKKRYVTLIISPLIGLMNDQVYNIKDLTSEAATINSDYTPDQKEEIKNQMRNGKLSILYLSPEALISISDIKDIIGDRKIGLFVIDEAHIVSTWGKSFRPDYWYLGDYISRLRNKLGYHFPLATFSATITFGGVDDMHVDIINSLRMRTGPNEFIGPVRRNNIGFDIRLHYKKNDYRAEKHEAVVNKLTELNAEGHKTLVYFPFVSLLRETSSDMRDHKIPCDSYFGSEDKDLKAKAMKEFRTGKVRTILCTKAFGMGIDIDDIDTVYHYAPTGNLCDYIQEIGRCARDKSIHGTAATDYFAEDFRYINQLYGLSSITNYQILATMQKIRDTYYAKKSRNFTISPDDFSYIFAVKNDMDRVDAELKTALLMIQKDFERDPLINFQPIIFKPRSLFTKGYVMILDQDVSLFRKNRFFKYFKLFRTKNDMASKATLHDRITYNNYYTGEEIKHSYRMDVAVHYQGDIYSVNYKEFWEQEFNNLTFAQFKWKLYNGELEGFEIGSKLKSEYLLHIKTYRKNFRDVIDGMSKILTGIRDGFAGNAKNKVFYTLDKIAEIIRTADTGQLTYEEANIAAANYINIMNAYESTGSFTGAPIFKHRENYDDWAMTSYAMLDRKTKRIIYDMKNLFSSVLDLYDKTFLVSLSAKQKNQSKLIMSRKEFNIAQLFELFKFATYEVTSGERPEYFIRINSIRAIERVLSTPHYHSAMVELSKQRHTESVEIMKKFFTDLQTDEERWDFIERYFVGMEV